VENRQAKRFARVMSRSLKKVALDLCPLMSHSASGECDDVITGWKTVRGEDWVLPSEGEK